MKTIRTVVIAICFAAKAASAQAPADQPAPPPGQHGPHGPHGPPGLDIDRLTVLLDLDPYQKQQVAQALQDQRNAMRAERQANEASGTKPTSADFQAHRVQAQQQLITKLTGVLSDAQITKLKVLMEPPQGGPGAGYRGRRAGDANGN
jgi:Spy/CpxP family protein refolding chaperone